MSDDNDPATTPKGNPVAARPMIGQHSPNRAALRFTRRFAAVLLGVGLASAPLALAAPLAIAADTPNNLKIAMTGDIDSLNPFTAITASASKVLALQYQNLVAFGPEDNTPVPGMADKWETSPDGKVWTFNLPEGRKWSDGEPITANDAAWTFNAIKANDALKTANGTLLESVAGVVAKDPQTLVITLNAAQAPNPGTQLPILPEHIWSKVSDPATFANDKDSVGSGPFTVGSYDKSAGVTMKANPNYWQGKAKVDGVIWVPYKTGDAAVQALKTGEVDIVSRLTPAQYEALKGEAGITTNAGMGTRYVGLGINPGTKTQSGELMGDTNPALQDLNVRKAIVMAVDNKTLLEKVLQGLGQPGTGEVPAAYPDYALPAQGLGLSFDPAAANKLLDENGYAKGPDGIRLDKTGKPLQLRLLGRSTDATAQQMADYIKPWLKDIGIELTVSMKANLQVNDDLGAANYDLAFTGWGMAPDPDYQLSINQCSALPTQSDGTGGVSENGLCLPEFDALYKQQHVELDQQKRSALVQQAQKLIYDAAVNNVIYYPNMLEAYRSDRFGGFVTQPAQNGVISEQNGPWGIYSATPVDSAGATAGFNWAWLVIPAVVVVLALAGFFWFRSRRSSVDDRA